MKQHKSGRGRGGDYESEEDGHSSEEELKLEEEEKEDTKLSTWKSWLKSTGSKSRDGSSTSAGRDMVANGSTTPTSKGLFIDPQNWCYVGWTQFILIWAVYSSFFTPLEFGFFRGLPENLCLLDIAGQFVFLIDIFVRFFVPYWDRHSYRFVFSHNLIAIRYLKSRFLVDFLGCLPWDAIYKGKESYLRNKLLESDMTLHIGSHECELAMKLNFAAYDGDLYRLKRLITAGANPNWTDYDGRSPLHLAASKGYEEITEFLIQQGVEINITDNFGNTPMLETIKNGHDHIASLLVKAGASLTIDNAGSCLCMAVARSDFNFLRRVLDNGINPNSKSYDLRTPLHVAAAEGLYTIACLLLDAGSSVFSKDRWGNTPLDEARIGGDKKLIKLLEDAKCAQLSEFSDCFKEIQGIAKTK